MRNKNENSYLLNLDDDAADKKPGFIRRAINAITPSKKTAGYWVLLALATAAAGATVFYWPAALAFVTTAFTAAAALPVLGFTPLAFLGGLSVLMTAVAAAAVVLAAGVTLWMGAKLAMAAFNKVFGPGKTTVAADPFADHPGDANLDADELIDDEVLDNSRRNEPTAPYQGAGAEGQFGQRRASAAAPVDEDNLQDENENGLNM